MTAGVYTTPNERVISGALALAMHLLFLVFLIVGVHWQKREPQPVVVDLWNDLPPLPAPKPPPAPEAKPAPAPPPPAPKVEVKPAPNVEPKVEPRVAPKPVPDPEIALKEKQEKERKAREQALAEKKKREQALAEKKRREAKALAEKKRQEERTRLAALKAQQAKEAEARRLAREQEAALRKLAAAQASAQAKLIDEYKRRIADKIKRFIVAPPNLQGNPEVEFAVTVLPGGEVLEVKTRRSSTVAAWDSAVERAIRRAQPLPLPPDPALMRDFRELNLKFRPKE
ncbi:MAG: cell envelope integrity protein TolA [Betaproteobacteria bacterium]|nr:cell envelope integrity protein TolA [Betaproteobacteria bacterium]